MGGGGAVDVIPVAPSPPVIVFIPTNAAGVGAEPLEKLTCDEPCVTSANCLSECAQMTRTIVSPPDSFVLECSEMGACSGSTITFDYPQSGVAKFVNSIKASAPYALYGSTVTINNEQTLGIKVITIECDKGYCAGATFVFNNAYFGDLKCMSTSAVERAASWSTAKCTETSPSIRRPCPATLSALRSLKFAWLSTDHNSSHFRLLLFMSHLFLRSNVR